jgi:heme-degrading monooxygenase HmoA
MVEANVTYNLVPNVDLKAYAVWAKKAIDTTLHAPGLIEFRAHRGLMSKAQVRTTTVWQSMADWAKFLEGPWQQLEAELRTQATNLRSDLWGPSAMVPEPLRPGK